MNPADFKLIRRELGKLESLPPWGRAQGDQWDRKSNFIYRVKTLQGVRRQAQAVARAEGLPLEAFGNYTIRRWYNHHSHDQILQMFLAHPDVQPETDRKHRTVDFYLRSIPFDLKISRFPRAYPNDFTFARYHPHHLAMWQYRNQSKQGRYHTGNRCFIVLHHQRQPALEWQLRRDFAAVATLVKKFLDTPVLLGLTLRNEHTGQVHQPWAAVIFHVKS